VTAEGTADPEGNQPRGRALLSEPVLPGHVHRPHLCSPRVNAMVGHAVRSQVDARGDAPAGLGWHRWTGVTVGLVLVFMRRPRSSSPTGRDEPAVYSEICSRRPAAHAPAAGRARQHGARSATPTSEIDYIRVKGAAAGSARIPRRKLRLSVPGPR